jgi:hypothetical protein
MTETYTLLDKGTIARPPLSDRCEQHYVTYTTPSPEDKAWDLYFAEASSPKGYYYALWRMHMPMEEKLNYPIFFKLATEYNWKPVESRPVPAPKCSHEMLTFVGFSNIERRRIYRCGDCQVLTYGNGSSINTGRYTVTNAEEVNRLRNDETERLVKLFLGRKP